VALLRKSRDDSQTAAAEQLSTLSDRIKPLAAETMERMQPAMTAARDRVVPAVAATRQRVGPAVESAKERLGEDVIPRLAGALAVAAETMSERAQDVHDRAYEVATRPERRRRRRRRRVMMLVAVGAGLAAGAAVLFRRNRADQWDKFEAQADDWAAEARKTAGEATESVQTGTTDAAQSMKTDITEAADTAKPGTTGTAGGTAAGTMADTDELGDRLGDTTGAAPGETVSDTSAIPGEPTSPDEPVQEVNVPKTGSRRAPRTSPKSDY
jgi:cytoskeletal protein RodZ